MSKILCKRCTNSACFIKKHCNSGWLNKIELKKIQIEHRAKEVIFREGGYVNGIYFIQRGKVKVVTKGINNREQIVRLAIEGHLLGHRGVGDDDQYPISATALSDTTVCFIDNDTLYDVLMDMPKLTLDMLGFYSRELRKAEIRMKYLAQMKVKERIAEALLFLKHIFGISPSDGTINVCLSRNEIGELTGLMSEQVSREFREFEKENLIAKNGRCGIKLLDENGLHEIVRKYGIEQYAEQR